MPALNKVNKGQTHSWCRSRTLCSLVCSRCCFRPSGNKQLCWSREYTGLLDYQCLQRNNRCNHSSDRPKERALSHLWPQEQKSGIALHYTDTETFPLVITLMMLACSWRAARQIKRQQKQHIFDRPGMLTAWVADRWMDVKTVSLAESFSTISSTNPSLQYQSNRLPICLKYIVSKHTSIYCLSALYSKFLI